MLNDNQIHEIKFTVRIKTDHLNALIEIPVYVHYTLKGRKATVHKAFSAIPAYSSFDDFWDLRSFEIDINNRIKK